MRVLAAYRNNSGGVGYLKVVSKIHFWHFGQAQNHIFGDRMDYTYLFNFHYLVRQSIYLQGTVQFAYPNTLT